MDMRKDQLKDILVRAIKYLFEGLAVALVALLLPKNKLDIEEIIIIGLAAAATFAVLDLFAPAISAGARTGAGFGIGANLVGFPIGL